MSGMIFWITIRTLTFNTDTACTKSFQDHTVCQVRSSTAPQDGLHNQIIRGDSAETGPFNKMHY